MSRIQSIPYTIPFVYRYNTYPRFDRRYPDTLFNLVTDKSLYSFRNTSSRDQLLGHIVHIMMMSYRVGPEIPLRLHGVTNPNLDSCQPNRYFRRYLQCTFIATQLRCDVWYTQSIPTVSGSCTISWSKEMILDIRKDFSKRTTRSCAMLRIGSCPSHHSPNDVIPLSMTSNVHSQETMTIC